MQYAAFLTMAALVFALWRRWAWCLAAALLAIVPAARVAPCFLKNPPPGSGTVPLRVVSFNVLVSNRDFEAAMRWVREQQPDIVYFTEVNYEWAKHIETLHDILPYSITPARDDSFGYAILSKHPSMRIGLPPGEILGLYAVVAELEFDGQRVTVVGAHPPPPIGAGLTRERDLALAELAQLARGITGPLVMVGDFNATPWCHAMKPLQEAGMADARRGLHYGPTWHRLNPVIAIPIDQALVRGPLRVDRCRTGPDLGSDHRPLTLDLLF